MTPESTFELKIAFLPQQIALKAQVMAFWRNEGITEFVEGCVDQIDIDPGADAAIAEQIAHLASDEAPLLMYSYDAEYLRGVAANLHARFGEALITKITTLPTETWLTGWQKAFEPIFTEQFVIRAPWHTIDNAGHRPLIIEPAMAFGTGQHESTRLCLRLLEGLERPPATVFDIGTGSGILAIGAAMLGSQTIHACDIDADSVVATKENAKLNSMPITVWQSGMHPVGKLAGGYELVIANILAPVIATIFPDLERCTRPGGFLLLSGFLDEQEAELVRIGATHGFSYVRSVQENDWMGTLLKKAHR